MCAIINIDPLFKKSLITFGDPYNNPDGPNEPKQKPPPASREQCLYGIRQGEKESKMVENIKNYMIHMTKKTYEKERLEIKKGRYVSINPVIFDKGPKNKIDKFFDDVFQ